MAKKNGQKAGRGKKIIRRLILVVLELALLVGVVAWVWVNQKMDKVGTDETFE